MNYAYGPVDVLSAHLFLLNLNGFVVIFLFFHFSFSVQNQRDYSDF